MNVYRPNSVDAEPEAILMSWRVYEVDFGPDHGKSRHFVGYNTVTKDGRVSSPIQTWDRPSRTGVSRSGRLYTLSDERLGFNLDAQHVFNVWLRRNQAYVPNVTLVPVDVSDEYRA